MTVRDLNPMDMNELKRIHAQFFQHEFDFPNFLNGYLCSFIIEDDKGIVTAGGIRPILESVVITNKNRSIRARVDALKQMLNISQYVCHTHRYDQLHCFIQDEQWYEQLVKYGFNPTVGKSLVLNV